jgi:hypothetical protein
MARVHRRRRSSINSRRGRRNGSVNLRRSRIEEAKRAVAELHDKEFLGRKLVVSGAKSNDGGDRS